MTSVSIYVNNAQIGYRRIKIANKFLGHGPCEYCGSRDNRANYSDGGWFCFGCRRSGRGTQSGFVRERDDGSHLSGADDYEHLHVPNDTCRDFPAHIQQYLESYSINIPTALRHGLQYSPYWDQLIYEYKDKHGKTRCIQARNFNHDRAAKAKYYNQGESSEVLPIYKETRDQQLASCNKRLVITEDALSAIRIASICDAMPALGTNVPAKKIVALRASYEFITIWLDRDKWREAREIAEKCQWVGFSANTVFSELDPKCYTNGEIMEYLK